MFLPQSSVPERIRVISTKDWAIIAAEAAAEKKAEDVMAINVAELLVVTDYFVIATGRTNIQVRAIADEIEDQLRDRGGIKVIGREGTAEAKWLLLDYGDLVIHVFQPEEREFYRLEKLWSDAPRLKLSAAVANVTRDADAELPAADSERSAE
jgi:ribosome-associated protein